METEHVKISVQSYAGSRAEEYPREVQYQHQRYAVTKVLAEEKIIIVGKDEIHRRFYVELEIGKKVELCYHENEDQWYILEPLSKDNVVLVDFIKKEKIIA